MRLFIAINLPSKIIDELRRIREELFDENITASITKNFHLTLKFLGETKKLDEIIEALKKISFEPFKLELKNLGVFPNKDYIRVAWVGIEESKQLLELHKQIGWALKPFGYKDDYEFKAHLTIARVKHIKDKKSFIEKLERTRPEQIRFLVKNFFLIKSELAKQGPIYNDLEAF
ncbi:RNA 2',3'-cyclic phosphodiesterase [Candidatus Woesearchaeota archaeon]|nr:RNA 2',3'-cyclic phosphodiesterase [Candidatus Woesearchaeota archaeon]